VKQGYTTREVAELLGFDERRIRELARAGVVAPERIGQSYLFGFRDLVLLRSAKALTDARVPHARIVRSLERLRAQLPADRSLTELGVRAEGGEVLAVEGDAAWNPESGQLQLAFDAAGPQAVVQGPAGAASDNVTPLARRGARAARPGDIPMDAEDWFELGLELESVSPVESRRAYERALEANPSHVNAHVNLGRLLHEAGEARAAAVHYRAALDIARDHPTAWFNLGVALEDYDGRREAVRAYLEALRLDPGLADAHYNLARLYEAMGDGASALRHLNAYRRIVQQTG